MTISDNSEYTIYYAIQEEVSKEEWETKTTFNWVRYTTDELIQKFLPRYQEIHNKNCRVVKITEVVEIL